jgi:hypothetical protein
MKNISLIVFIFSIFLSGCNNTVGDLELKGKVLDENTKVAIPNRTIIVQAIVQSEDNSEDRYIDDFTTDSSGCFSYTLKKVKNVSLYNFSVEGDSDYEVSDNILGLTDLNIDGKSLSFYAKRFADFTIIINRISKTPLFDTLLLSWKTNGVDGTTIYPYKIENYRINPDQGLIWIGGDVKSVIKTKVYAEKNTIVRWELFRDGKDKVISDTIFCLRDAANRATLNY